MNVPTEVLNRHVAGFKRREQTMPELFELDFWRKQESYSLLKRYCNQTDSILEVGCLNGHHCLLLAEDGYKHVIGIEYNRDCINLANTTKARLGLYSSPHFLLGEFPQTTVYHPIDKIILFDVIEHVTNLQGMFEECVRLLSNKGEVLVLVPKGKCYYDEGHINFWPDEEALSNHLTIYFKVVECNTVEDGKKLFARCNHRMSI